MSYKNLSKILVNHIQELRHLQESAHQVEQKISELSASLASINKAKVEYEEEVLREMSKEKISDIVLLDGTLIQSSLVKLEIIFAERVAIDGKVVKKSKK